MKKIAVLLLLCSCASTGKLLETREPYEVAKIEQKRFSKKQLPAPRDYRVWSIVAMCFISVTLTH